MNATHRTRFRVEPLEDRTVPSVNFVESEPNDTPATAGFDGTARVWDAATGRAVHTLRGHKERLDGVAFTPDGRRLASASLDATVRVWDLATGDEVRTCRGHNGMVWGVAFSPDGAQLAAGTGIYGRGDVRIWDATVLAGGRDGPRANDRK